MSPDLERAAAGPELRLESGGARLRRAAIVVIGRNEGERLAVSLRSAIQQGLRVLYVDSGSKDGSPGTARSLGVDVLELDPSRPMSAARARNEGFDRVMSDGPADCVQFLDGDCELAAGWSGRAVAEMERRSDAAVVCGKLTERRADASIYNRLCALEWDRPAGDVAECGGIMMVRSSAFREAGGFDARIVAGEDPELCLRLRRAGWKIVRLDADMAVHDAAIHHFSQWWTRAVRGGHAYAHSAALHGRSTDRYRVRECRSIRTWALWIPLVIACLAWPTHGWSLLGLALYPLQAARIARRERRRGGRRGDALLYGFFCLAAKWPQLLGQVRYWRNRGREPRLIEYKGGDSP